jgi:hypothetical protein
MGDVTMAIVGLTATHCPSFGATRRVSLRVEESNAQRVPNVTSPGSVLRLVIFESMVQVDHDVEGIFKFMTYDLQAGFFLKLIIF